MPSSLAEPHNYFLGETYCLPEPLSLITIEKKQVLTGVTGRAALMSVPGPPLSPPSPWQMVECLHVSPVLTTGSIVFFLAVMGCKAWCLSPKQTANAWIWGCFSGGDVSLTMVSMLSCSESEFQSGHLRALIPTANYDFVLSKETLAGISMGERECGRQCACTVCLEECLHFVHM